LTVSRVRKIIKGIMRLKCWIKIAVLREKIFLVQRLFIGDVN